jgi:hypothetical protein
MIYGQNSVEGRATSWKLEAGMESDEVDAGREVDKAVPGCTWDTLFSIAENFRLLGEGDGEGDSMRVPSPLPSSPLIPMRCMGWSSSCMLSPGRGGWPSTNIGAA